MYRNRTYSNTCKEQGRYNNERKKPKKSPLAKKLKTLI